LDADAIAIQSHRNHGKISETTAGALRAAGYPVEFTFNGDHVTIKLPGPPVDDVLTDFRNVFGELRPNPKLNLASIHRAGGWVLSDLIGRMTS